MLLSRGVKKGEKVAILMFNSLEWRKRQILAH